MADAEAQDRNGRLVSQLESSGVIRDPAIGAAFRAVPRHHFLPGLPLEEVYEDVAILTKMSTAGLPVSSSSQPAIMSVMLHQLQLQAGHRVLEIGAGTGYNAALIAHLVGSRGHVVTLDIDEELCGQARTNLAEAGVDGVEVVQGDGAVGWPAAAPYDRIILTVSTTDLAPVWLEQLLEEGVLVAPLALAGPVQQTVAFVRRGRALESREISCCGFMPLRGQMAPPPPVDDARGEPWLLDTGRPSDYTLPAEDVRAGFESWLALTEEAYVRPRLRPEDAPVFGLRGAGGAALLLAEDDAFRIMVFGEGAAAGEALARVHRDWAPARPQVDQLHIEAHPHDANGSREAGSRTVARPNFTFVVTRPQ